MRERAAYSSLEHRDRLRRVPDTRCYIFCTQDEEEGNTIEQGGVWCVVCGVWCVVCGVCVWDEEGGNTSEHGDQLHLLLAVTDLILVPTTAINNPHAAAANWRETHRTNACETMSYATSSLPHLSAVSAHMRCMRRARSWSTDARALVVSMTNLATRNETVHGL